MDIKIIHAFFFLIIISGCGNSKEDYTGNNANKEQVLPAMHHDSTQHYLAYLPANYEQVKPTVLLLIFDPQGNPQPVMEMLEPFVNQLGWIMAGALNSKNGMDSIPAKTHQFIQEVQQAYTIDHSHIIACGFSGGGRIAEYAALSYPQITALIVAGASVTDAQKLIDANVTTTLIAGTRDFNFYEVYGTYNIYWNKKPDIHFFFHEGKHEWPEKILLEAAILRNVNQWENKNEPNILVNNLLADIANEMEKRYLDHQWLKFQWANSSSYMRGEKPDYSNFPSLNKRLQQILVLEQQQKQEYLDAFNNKSISWWKKEIENLVFRMESEPAGFKRDMYYRLKGFLGIAAYSMSNAYVRQQEWQKLAKTLPIYTILEPENPDMYYFKARLHKMHANKDSARFFAKKALSSGYADTMRIYHEFDF